VEVEALVGEHGGQAMRIIKSLEEIVNDYGNLDTWEVQQHNFRLTKPVPASQLTVFGAKRVGNGEYVTAYEDFELYKWPGTSL
jgi:hypothetical protein